jgi:PAS domain S-box-containing protein
VGERVYSVTDGKTKTTTMDGFPYELIFESTPDAVFVADVGSGDIVAANPAAADLVGRDRDDVVGSHFSTYHPDDEREEYERLFREFVEAGGAVREGLHLLTDSGERIPVEYSSSVVEHDGRRLMQATVRDISDRKELEAQLRTERERYRQVFAGSNDAIFVVDPDDGVILDCNDRACRLLGYEVEELEGMPVSEVHPEEMDRFRALADEVFEAGTGWTDELSCLTKAGERIPAIVAGSTIEWDGKRAMLASVQDISEQRRRERALDEIQQSARRLLQARSRQESARVAADAVAEVLETPYGTVWFREDGAFEPAATTDEAATDGLPCAENPSEYLAEAVDASDGGVVERPPPATAADDLETVLVAPLADVGALSVGLTEGDRTETEPRFVEVLAANASAAVERSDREADLRRVTEELTILNRVVRHDIRNDAALLIGELERAKTALGDEDGEVADRIGHALGDAEHVVDVTETVGDLVDVVTGEDAEPGTVDLVATLAREVERARSVHADATFDLDVRAEPIVTGNEMLSSVFRNLLNNAVDHNDADSPAVDVTVNVDGAFAEVRVADDGPGIPDDRKTELFERGEQRLDSAGIGLGLYLVERLTTRFGGDVTVEDADSGGAAFVVRLQRAASGTS